MSAGKDQSLALTAACTAVSITIHLPGPGSYRICKLINGEWSEPLWNRPIGSQWIDNDVAPGMAVEYRVEEINTKAVGYILAGSKIPLVDNRGKLVLVVQSTHAAALEKELLQFEQDLAGDGYETIRRDIPKSFSCEQVKALIKSEWEKDKENVRTVILLGAIPVFHSGFYSYDGHDPVVVAADTFYANLDGDWQAKPSIMPGKANVVVGRIDFSNLVNFQNKTNNPRSEMDLLRQYLNRNSAWRRGQWNVTARGAIRDGFGDRDFSRNGWGNMPQLCSDGIDEIADGQVFSTLKDKDYLICHLCGGGQITSMAGTGGSDDCATNSIKVPFVMLLGSAMLGRWDKESSLPRSFLASGDDEKGCLVVFGAGAPHVWFHSCGLGEPIGRAWLRSVNNFTIYPGTGNPEAPAGGYTPAESTDIPPCLARVHQAFFGDPTLPLRVVKPVTNLMARTDGSTLHLDWYSQDVTSGYYVYRSANPNGPFARLTTEPITINGFDVADHFAGLHYMVRAVELKHTPSGSYYAASCGTFWSDSQTPPMPPDPAKPMSKATFIEADTTTQGNWTSKYGADGFHLCAGTSKLTPYATVVPGIKDDFVWSDYTQDIRALINTVANPRLAAVWAAKIGFTVEIKSDALPHRLALYFLDWDKAGRQQRVDILGQADAVLDTRYIDKFSNGVWLVWDYAGPIKIRITNHLMGVTNCVLSALMFGPVDATPAPTPNVQTLEIQSGPTATGPWTVRGTVEVEAAAEKGFYRLRIL